MQTIIKTVRFPTDLLEELKKEAEKNRVSVNELCIRKLRSFTTLRDLYERLSLLEFQFQEHIGDKKC